MPPRRRSGRTAAILLAISAFTACVWGQISETDQNPAPPALHVGSLEVNGSIRARGQGWNWFEEEVRDRYAFGETQVRLGFSQHRRRWDWRIEFEQPGLWNLPDDAFFPPTGQPIGLGATLFLANGSHRNSASAYIRQGYIKIRGFWNNGSGLTFGRFDFSDGGEIRPQDKTLAWIKRERIANRLIGDANWTSAGRTIDGINLSYDLGSENNFTFVAGRPTRGVYQTDGWGEAGVDLFYGAYTREFPTRRTASEARIFAIGYHDGRGVLKTDNRPLALRQADKESLLLGTFGFHYTLTFPIRYTGQWDLTWWGAYQTGQWGNLSHRAYAAFAEMGWQPRVRWVHPWIRAGAMASSADGNPLDGRHTTFFQLLPTARQYARVPFYNMQNVEDYSGELILRPGSRLTVRGSVRKVKLHGVNDLWYQGSGAFQQTSFGFEGYPNNGHRGLANVLDFGVDYRIGSHWDVNGYAGAISGKSILTNQLRGRKAGMAYLELGYSF